VRTLTQKIQALLSFLKRTLVPLLDFFRCAEGSDVGTLLRAVDLRPALKVLFSKGQSPQMRSIVNLKVEPRIDVRATGDEAFDRCDIAKPSGTVEGRFQMGEVDKA